MRIASIVGARPQLIKVAPVSQALRARGHREILIHTGQHYDDRMSEVFFRQLGIPEPDHNLDVGSGPHGAQTGLMLERIERVLAAEKPDWVVVFGDTNSTLAGSLCAAKMEIPVAHVEAGLRSFDRSMPEEINRIVTDQVAALLLTPSSDADENLRREGIGGARVRLVGNVMIDTLERMLPLTNDREILGEHGLLAGDEGADAVPFVLVTLHRPSNVDSPRVLDGILGALGRLAGRCPVLFPIHPRTRGRIGKADLGKGVRFLDPMGYLEFLALMRHAAVVVTDSGGIQEETTCLDVPCVTVRENTERPVTLTMGTNVLVGRDPERLEAEANRALSGGWRHAERPPLWDGRTADRIAEALEAAAAVAGN